MFSDWIYKAWMEGRSREKFEDLYLGNWEMNDAVHKREDIEKMVDRGEISDTRAEEMMRMRWTVNRKGEKVIDRERELNG